MNSNAEIIRPDSKEKLIMSVTLYQGGDTLFYDSALTKPVTQEEAIDLFNKGLMLVAVEDGFKRPTGITIGEEGAYTIVFGEGGSDNGAIVCYGTEFGDSFYLFEDSECAIPITSDKDPRWYSRLLLRNIYNGRISSRFEIPRTCYLNENGDDHYKSYISFESSSYYLDYNG